MDREDAEDRVIYGRHPVLEAIVANRPLQRVLIARGSHGAVIDEIFEQLRTGAIPYDIVDREILDRLVNGQHQGVVAHLTATHYSDFDHVLANLEPSKAFLVFLDCIQDPHNLGAVIRSAHAVGADAVVIPERGASGLTATAAKAAAGAASHIPVCRVKNLQRALTQVRAAGIWIAGLEADAPKTFSDSDLTGPVALVIGSESKGLRRLTRRTCDYTLCIPMERSEVGSLNASVAAGLVLYEVFRQRTVKSCR